MDMRDVALQSVTPTIMVPRHTHLDELAEPGHRILSAVDGYWLEVCRAWLYARVKVGGPLSIPVPYGEVQETIRFKFGKLPRFLVDQFIEQARARCPNECAGWGIWNESTGEWRLQMLEETSVGPAHVKNQLPKLEEGEYMVLDLHSHGKLRAFFSKTDNADDRGECKIAGVVGNLDKEEISVAFRLCTDGAFTELPFI